jgi:hypothetical protein
MTPKAPVFDKIVADYLRQIAGLDNTSRYGEILGITRPNGGYRMPFFDRWFTISADRIADDTGAQPNHAVSVILFKYILLCPDRPYDDPTLATYKDFKDAAPYVGGFRNTAEKPIARHFQGRLADLRRKCLQLSGAPFQTEASYQLAFRFQALPRVPLFLLFNDADEDFPSQCTLLFQKSAACYLDMECIAMVGSVLAARLVGKPDA